MDDLLLGIALVLALETMATSRIPALRERWQFVVWMTLSLLVAGIALYVGHEWHSGRDVL